MDSQQNKQLVQEAYRLFMSGDIRGVIERCQDDAVWTSPESDNVPFSGTFRGKQGIADFFAKLDGSTRTIRFEPQEFFADGDRVVVLGHSTWEVKSTGRTLDSQWAHVFTMRDGKMARFEAISDTAAAVRAFQPDQPAAQTSMGSQLHH